jgi:hypothetical protein
MNLASQVGNLKKWKKEKEKEKVRPKDDKKDGEFINAKELLDKTKSMKRGKSTWYWRTCHKLWQKHEVKDCRLNPANKNRPNDN